MLVFEFHFHSFSSAVPEKFRVLFIMLSGSKPPNNVIQTDGMAEAYKPVLRQYGPRTGCRWR